MIKQFSKINQFINVTHNKQTSSAIDVSYAVTMLEAVVGKLMPVNLRSFNN